jgi:hypothetical protein
MAGMQGDPRTKAAKAAIRRARLYNCVSRVVRWSLAVFFISLALLFAVFWVASRKDDYYVMVFGLSVVACIIFSGITHIFSMMLRELLLFGWVGWHFSVRALLILMTTVALALGFAVLAIR